MGLRHNNTLTMSKKYLVYIDASNIGSGGGIGHLINVLKGAPSEIKGKEIIYKVWCNNKLLSILPNKHNIEYKHGFLLSLPSPLNLFWNIIVFRIICFFKKPNYIFCPGGYLLFSYPNSTIVFQNILPFLKDEIKRVSLFQKLRNNIRYIVLKRSSKNASKYIFHTNNSYSIISQDFSSDKNYSIIPHGINDSFRVSEQTMKDNLNNLENKITQNKTICYTYIASGDAYKNNHELLESFNFMNKKNSEFILNLVLSNGPILSLILKEIEQSKIKHKINLYLNYSTNEIIKILHHKTDIFLFSSSCETFGLTLVEGMASGLPIFAIKKSCIPEVLGGNACYFDVFDKQSLYSETLNYFHKIDDLKKITFLTWKHSKNYQWDRTVNDTWNFIFS